MTIPWTIGRGYRDLGLTVERDLILRLVHDLLDADERIAADLPEQVELTLHQTGERTVVHLVNLSGAHRSGFAPPLPVRDGILRFLGLSPAARAHALVSDTACAITTNGDEISVAVPQFGLFEVIVIGDAAEISK